jgi:hypothetical protein
MEPGQARRKLLACQARPPIQVEFLKNWPGLICPANISSLVPGQARPNLLAWLRNNIDFSSNHAETLDGIERQFSITGLLLTSRRTCLDPVRSVTKLDSQMWMLFLVVITRSYYFRLVCVFSFNCSSCPESYVVFIIVLKHPSTM